MALKGELFNQDMVRALLDGRKKHTARPIKPRRKGNFIDRDLCGNVCEWKQIDCETRQHVEICKPKFQPGDFMYVRETWNNMCADCDECDPRPGYIYKADGITRRPGCAYEIKWRPSIHMPREAARLFYKVTKVEVMRLKDVNEQFAREDGFEADEMDSALDKFKRFWFDTYGADARWMWVYWMERVSKEEAYETID